MIEINFRIIELENHQVLIQKDFDDKEEKDIVIIVFFNDGIKIKHSYGYNDEESRNKVFDSITDVQIQELVNNSLKMF